MKQTVVVVAPHPDDETLGCGGTLLKHLASGDDIYWVIVTKMSTHGGYSEDSIRKRKLEIEKVSNAYSFKKTHSLDFIAGALDHTPLSNIIDPLSQFFLEIQPTIVYTPFSGDAHSDHLAVFNAVAACTKSFRYPSVMRILAYETLSETDFMIDPRSLRFEPNVFVNITPYIDKKIEIANYFESEMKTHPFPRSETSLRALATLRGSASGFIAAEAFMLLKEKIA